MQPAGTGAGSSTGENQGEIADRSAEREVGEGSATETVGVYEQQEGGDGRCKGSSLWSMAKGCRPAAAGAPEKTTCPVNGRAWAEPESRSRSGRQAMGWLEDMWLLVGPEPVDGSEGPRSPRHHSQASRVSPLLNLFSASFQDIFRQGKLAAMPGTSAASLLAF